MPSLYKNAQFVIYASQTENCPNILLEAYSYKYIQASSDILGNVFIERTNLDNQSKKSTEPNGN